MSSLQIFSAILNDTFVRDVPKFAELVAYLTSVGIVPLLLPISGGLNSRELTVGCVG